MLSILQQCNRLSVTFIFHIVYSINQLGDNMDLKDLIQCPNQGLDLECLEFKSIFHERDREPIRRIISEVVASTI